MIAAFDFEPDGARFIPRIAITIVYDPNALPVGIEETNLAIALLDEADSKWVFVTGEVNPDANRVRFSIDHFTAFAILAAAPTASPAPTVEGGGSSTGAWIGIGIGILLILGRVVWLVVRRW